MLNYDDKNFTYNDAYRMCEKILLQYPDIQRLVLEAKSERFVCLKGMGDSNGRSGGLGDPTFSAVVKNSELIETVIIRKGRYHRDIINHAEQWFWAINKLLKFYGADSKYYKIYWAKFIKNIPSSDILNNCLADSMQDLSSSKRKIICDCIEFAKAEKIFKEM